MPNYTEEAVDSLITKENSLQSPSISLITLFIIQSILKLILDAALDYSETILSLAKTVYSMKCSFEEVHFLFFLRFSHKYIIELH